MGGMKVFKINSFVYFIFQFPWLTLCNSDVVPQEGLLRNLSFLTKNVNKRIKMVEFLRNKTDKDTLIYRDHIYVWENFLVDQFVSDRYDIGIVQEDFIALCKFKGKNCYDYFTIHPHHTFGNCFTFKVPKNVIPTPHIERGLSLMLKSHDVMTTAVYNAQTNIDGTNSIRLVLHEENTVPDMINEAMEIVPGHSTSISLVQQKLHRINTPSSKCNENAWFESSGNMIKETRRLCSQSCIIAQFYRNCGCITVQNIGTRITPYKKSKNIPIENAKHCLYINLSDMDETLQRGLCEVRTQNTVDKMTRPCMEDCKWNCEETQYKTTVSYAKWPQNAGVKDFIKKYVIPSSNTTEYKRYWFSLNDNYNTSYLLDKSSMLKYMDLVNNLYDDENATKLENIPKMLENKTILPILNTDHKNLPTMQDAEIKWVQSSFYRLNVYFKDPIVEVHTQVLDSSFADLCSGIGGSLGLWVGCSVISIIEVLTLLGGIAKIGCKSLHGKLFHKNIKSMKVVPEKVSALDKSLHSIKIEQ